jgi:hypothetical protein
MPGGGDLRHLAVEEISIGFTRPDGSTSSTPVWAVQVGEALFSAAAILRQLERPARLRSVRPVASSLK